MRASDVAESVPSVLLPVDFMYFLTTTATISYGEIHHLIACVSKQTFPIKVFSLKSLVYDKSK